MPPKTAVAGFDYGTLDRETADFLQQQTGEIRALMRRSAQDVFEIGEKLIAIKQRLGHGRFLGWLEAEFDWTDRTANRFMSVAERFGNKADKLTDLHVAPSALYLLAAPSTDEAVRQEALALAETGESLTYKKAVELKKKHQAPPSLPRQRRRERRAGRAGGAGGAEGKTFPSSPSSSPSPTAPPPLPTQIAAAAAVVDVKATPVPDRQVEIVSIRPPSPPDGNGNRKADLIAAATPRLPPDSWHQVGEHLLFCGYPNSPQFREKLPDQLSLTLAFPPSADWQIDKPAPANSAFAFYSAYPDLDTELLRQTVSNLLLLCTEEKEAICFAFLPDPHFLDLAGEMGCRAFVAEPDQERCQSLLAAWAERQRGGEGES